jgi:hypothetical protein
MNERKKERKTKKASGGIGRTKHIDREKVTMNLEERKQ